MDFTNLRAPEVWHRAGKRRETQGRGRSQKDSAPGAQVTISPELLTIETGATVRRYGGDRLEVERTKSTPKARALT